MTAVARIDQLRAWYRDSEARDCADEKVPLLRATRLPAPMARRPKGAARVGLLINRKSGHLCACCAPCEPPGQCDRRHDWSICAEGRQKCA